MCVVSELGVFPDQRKKLNPCVGFASGVQMPLPEKDALVAHCHAQTISSFNARPVSQFAGNWAENFFSDRMDAISVGSQEFSVLDEHEVNPAGFCVKMGGFWHFLASGVSCTQGKKKLMGYILCTHLLIYW